jgi:hypothetical protein
MPEPEPNPRLLPGWEWFGVGFILLCFLTVNLLVATRTPTVYIDEPVFADPAANLYYGSGFTSTMWGEDRHELWCSQPPLYTALLYVFFKCFGFGLFQARAANSVLAAAGALLVWAAARRARLVQSPVYRLVTLALILSGSLSVLTFRMIRYDVGMFLVSALVFFTCCLPAGKRGRYLWVALASIFCPLVGVPMLPFVGMMLLIFLAVYQFRGLPLAVSVGTGFTLGAGLLFLYFYHFGVLGHFLKFVHGATHNDTGTPALVPTLKTILFGEQLGEESLLTSFFGNPMNYSVNMKTLFDYSAFLLFILFVLLASKIWRVTNGPIHRLILFILATTLVLPPVIQLAGHYWSDYRWMTYIPLTIAVPRLLELSQEFSCAPMLRRAAFGVIGLSLSLGLPARSLLAVPDWSERSVTPLERVAARVVQPSDVVICQCRTYFAIRPHAQLVFCTGLSAMGEFRFIKDLPTNQVSLICLYPTNVAEFASIAGGKWKKVPLDNVPEAAALSHTRYAVEFYRRDTNSTP